MNTAILPRRRQGTAPTAKRAKRRTALRKRLEALGLFVPARVLAARESLSGFIQVLVDWKGYRVDQATWEPLKDDPHCPIHRKYVAFMKKTRECAEFLATLSEEKE